MSLDLHALMVFNNQRLSRELASRTMPIVMTETALVFLVALCVFLETVWFVWRSLVTHVFALQQMF